jgi:hypothetical protein
MRQPLIAIGSQSVAEAPNRALREPSDLTGLSWRELLLDNLANHMDPPQFAPPHDNPVLSDHPALPS